MKTLSICLIAIGFALMSSGSWAQYYNTQRYGNQTYYSGSNGYQGSEQHFGNQSYYRDNQGTNCTTTRYGSQSYTNCY